MLKIIILFFLFISSLNAADFDEIYQAYKDGNYEIALNGFMIWNYVDNSNNYKKIFQQTVDYLDLESTTYIYFDASGGEITSTTHASNEIEATIGFNIGDSYNIIGSFEPGLDFNKGNIVVSLENIDYSQITIRKEIIIESTNE